MVSDYFLGHRPKRLLIFINPKSGRGKSVSLYEKLAAPLFKIASVETDVIGVYNGPLLDPRSIYSFV